jgi:hypothetical protein
MSGLNDYMLPCLWKQTFNIDCLGCGFQRSLVFMTKGEFSLAFKMYPAIYTILFMLLYMVLHTKYKFTNGHKVLLALFVVNIIIILTSYIFKFI